MTEAETKSKPWAGFWRRLAAYVVDMIILSAVGFAIGTAAHDWAVSLGMMGRLVGLALELVYFGVLNSSLGGGRTLGKRLLGIQLVRRDGKPPGLAASSLRALVLCTPFLLNGFYVELPNTLALQIFGAAAVFAVFGVLPVQIYLFLFNLPSRRMLHDLLVGTYVVHQKSKPVGIKLGLVHRIVMTLILLPILALATVPQFIDISGLINLNSFTRPLEPLQSPLAAVNALPEVAAVNVNDNTTNWSDGDGPKTTRTLIVTVRLKTEPANQDQEIARIARAVIQSYKFEPGQRLEVRIDTGYDLGIARWTVSHGDREPPEHWAPAKPQPAVPEPAGAALAAPTPAKP